MALEGIGTSIASDLAKDLLYTLKRQAQYCFCFNGIVEDLGTEKRKLASKQEVVLKRADDAKNQTEHVTGEVENWLLEAKECIVEAEKLEEEAKIKGKCFLGWCPNCFCQYHLGRKMSKKAQKLTKLSANSEFQLFSRPGTLPGIGYYCSEDFIHFKSREFAHDKLLEALRDSQNSRIGLYGMGGLGKTTLVKEVGKEVEKSKPFDKVAFVVVSNTPNVRKIQENIASSLGLEFKEEHESYRAQRLFLRLTNGEKILLILDDVWGKLDFKAIGIPSDNNHQGFCRVLLTTRSALVCRSMNCQPEINLSLLSKEDAWILFNKHASIDGQSSKNLQDVAQEIAMQCKGLPVAIAAVASTLKGRPPYVWNAAFSTLKNSYPMVDIDEDLIEIYKCLRLSYDNLEIERAKGLFLLCSLFPEDYEIPMEDLTRYAISLDLFGEADSYETLRIRVQEAKNKLIDSCLLLNEFDKQECVRMHDLVREVAHVIANKEIQVVIGPKKDLKTLLKDKTIKDTARFLWFHMENKDKTPDQLGCPKLKILVAILEHFSKNETFLMEDAFFGGIECLQVLTLIKLPRLNMLPLQIPELINLRTLRLNNWTLGDISVIGRLKRLETLELEGCSIMELPVGILELNKLRLLGLLYCEVEKNPYPVLGRLSQLEEMYFTRSSYAFLHWNFDNKNISKYFDEENWQLTRLKRYCLEIGDVRLPHVSMNSLKSKGLSIEFFDASTSNATINDLVQRAEILHLKKVQGGYKSINPGLVQAIGGMTELIELSLYSCSDIECLVDSTKHLSQVENIFSRLVILKLDDMDNFTELCHGPPPLEFLQKIEKINLDKCRKLHNLLFVRNLNLHNLKSVKVTDCPILTSLFSLSIAHSLEHLEELRVEGCKALKSIFEDQRERESQDDINQETKMDAYDQMISYDSMLPKCKIVDIRSCDSLQWIFPLSFASGLKQLETVDVEGVAELKHIFGPYHHEGQPLHGNVKEIMLPSLREINFFRIPSFISIFDMDTNSIYSSLQSSYGKESSQLERSNLESTTSMELHTSKYKNSGQLSLGATAQCLSRQSLNLCLLREITLSGIPTLVCLFTLSTAQEMLLEYLAIFECHGLKHIITTEEDDHDHKSNGSVAIFSKLRSLIVGNCNMLEIVLPVSLAHGLVQLEYLEVDEAPRLEYIFGHDDHLSHKDGADVYIELPALKELDLRKLPKTISICPNKYCLTWPLLNDLILKACPRLRTSSIINCKRKKESGEIIKDGNVSRINEVQDVEKMLNIESLIVENDGESEGIFQVEVQAISSPQTTLSSRLQYLNLKDLPELRFICMCPLLLSFQNLSELHVKRCGKLGHVFSVNVLRSLPQLRFLTIEYCNKVEQIVEDREDQLMFKHNNSHNVCFPKLSQIIIRKCNKLRYLFALYSSSELPQLHKLVIEEASELEEVFRNKMNQNEYREKTVLPSLCDLELKKLPRLVGVCQGFVLQNVERQDMEDCPKYHDGAPEESSSSEPPENIYAPSSSLTQQNGMSSVKDYATFRNIEAIKHLGGKEKNIEVNMEMGQTAIQIRDANIVLAETSIAIHQAKTNTTLTNSNETDASPQITAEHPSVSLLPEVDSSIEEYANFKDIGSIKKKHIPLLEEAIGKYPSLWTWRHRFKRSHMKRSGYISLGDMLEFLASTKWKDLTEEKNTEFESLVDELEAYEFDVQWLQKTRAMIERRKLDDETIDCMKTLEVQVMEQEIEVQKAKAKLEATKLELEAIRAKVGKFDDFIGF